MGVEIAGGSQTEELDGSDLRMTESENQWRSRAKALSARTPSSGDVDLRQSSLDASPQSPSPSSSPQGWQPLDAATAFATAPEIEPIAHPSGDENEPRVGQRARRSVSWIEWAGFVAISGLLIAAWIMHSRHPESTPRGAATEQPPSKRVSSDATSDPEKLSESDAGSTDIQVVDETPAVRARNIAREVLADAGDGSFALEGLPIDPSEKLPPTDQPAAKGAASKRRAVNEKPATMKILDGPTPDPMSIIPIAREANVAEPAKPFRIPLTLPDTKPVFVAFDRIYPLAFQAHQSYLKSKKSDPNSEQSDTLLIECVNLFKQCLSRPKREFTSEQGDQITYTLAGLCFDAGRLYEAGVYALHVTHSADASTPIATAAATLAFASFQEAHLTHYGDPKRAGELRQMEQLCDLITARGMNHPQLDTMRFSTAQLFERDGFHVRAAQNYSKVPETSPLLAKAQLAAGREFWAEAIYREQDGIKKQLNAIIRCAANYLNLSVEQSSASDTMTPTLMAGTLALAEIALLSDAPEKAIELLNGPGGVLRPEKESPKMPDDFVTVAYERLFEAYSQTSDIDGIQSSLDELAKRYGRKGKDRIARLQTKTARDYLDSLAPEIPITSDDVVQVDAVMESVLNPKRKPSLDVLLWAAQAWSDLAGRTEDPSVRTTCASRSNELLLKASNSNALDDAQQMTLRLKRIDLMQASGQTESAISLLSEILRQSPTAVDLQIQAAQLLLDAANASSDDDMYATAISGRPDESIWGWAKLTNTLVRMHFDSEDKSRYFDRVLRSGLRLNECRILQAQATSSNEHRKRLLTDADKHLGQLLTTFAQSSDEWTAKLQSLRARIKNLD